MGEAASFYLPSKLCWVPDNSSDRLSVSRVDRTAIQVRTWNQLSTAELYSILKLRTDVFFLEQQITEEELDYRDLEPTTVHLWLPDEDGTIVAYLRVIEDAEPEYLDARHLPGRVVVHPDHRGAGLARVLLAEVIDRFGDRALLLHAQSYIVPLYAAFGFELVGPEFEEAGIAHRTMYRAADKSEVVDPGGQRSSGRSE
jgi:ElaA protein